MVFFILSLLILGLSCLPINLQPKAFVEIDYQNVEINGEKISVKDLEGSKVKIKVKDDD